MVPLVSILIPAYNAEKWFAQTMQSALDQTWSNKEIIVVDDGSTDGTLTVARRYAAERVKVVTQPNQGASAARNHAFTLAQGDYIQWFDADDLLAPDKVERQMAAVVQDDDPRILYSGAWGLFFYRISRAKFQPTPLWEDLSPAEWLYRKMAFNLHMQPDSWLVSRELTEKAGPWDTTLWRDNDGEYFGRVISASSGIRFIPESRSYYRRSGQTSVSYVGTSMKKIESLYRSINLHIDYLLSLEDTERTRQAVVAYITTWLYYFYPVRMDLVQRLQERAHSLGKTLPPPKLAFKYRAIRSMFGWEMAKRAKRTLPFFRATLERSWDRICAAISD